MQQSLGTRGQNSKESLDHAAADRGVSQEELRTIALQSAGTGRGERLQTAREVAFTGSAEK